MKDLKERPICAVDGCDHPALVFLAGGFVCGDCCVNYEKMKNKSLMKELGKVKRMDENGS